jgi:glycosyltransferase involved in cell wall biosynthesis
MHACRDDGWKVEFACADGPWVARLKTEGFGYRPVPMTRAISPPRQLHAIVKLARSLGSEPPDLVHTHTPVGGVVGRAAAMLTWRGPLVHTFHGLPLREGSRSMGELAFLAVERVLAGRTTHFFSQAAGDVDLAVGLGIARRERTTVIGNGVDVRLFAPDAIVREEVRRELELPSSSVVVLTVARLVREKGLLDLADAVASLADLRELHVLIAGSALPTDRSNVGPALDAHPAAHLLGSRWQRLGYRADVARLLQAADIFVLPSYREGLPRSVIEAMAAGVAIVASDIPACRELVEHDASGLLVPPGQPVPLAAAIRRLVLDANLRERLAARARERALQRHDERDVVRRQTEVLRGLVSF